VGKKRRIFLGILAGITKNREGNQAHLTEKGGAIVLPLPVREGKGKERIR